MARFEIRLGDRNGKLLVDKVADTAFEAIEKAWGQLVIEYGLPPTSSPMQQGVDPDETTFKATGVRHGPSPALPATGPTFYVRRLPGTSPLAV